MCPLLNLCSGFYLGFWERISPVVACTAIAEDAGALAAIMGGTA